jgi:hypothetical protein
MSLPAEDLPPGLDPILTAPPHVSDLAFETGLTILIRGFEEILNSLRPQQHN